MSSGAWPASATVSGVAHRGGDGLQCVLTERWVFVSPLGCFVVGLRSVVALALVQHRRALALSSGRTRRMTRTC
jgi:hypothetical protein